MAETQDLTTHILEQLNGIAQDAGPFAEAIRANDISRADQMSFALRLCDLALAIRNRPVDTTSRTIDLQADFQRPSVIGRQRDEVSRRGWDSV